MAPNIPQDDTGASDTAGLAKRMADALTPSVPEAEAEPAGATIHQLPGTKPRRVPRPGGRDSRRGVHPATGSPDRWAMVPDHVIRDRTLPDGAVRLFAELQRQVGEAPTAARSLGVCLVTMPQLAANLDRDRNTIRRWLSMLADRHLVEYRAAADNKRGLMVTVLWTNRARR